MTTFRRRVDVEGVDGGVFVTATRGERARWKVIVTDFRYEPVGGATRAQALKVVLDELSSLRHHIWTIELGHERDPQT